MRAAVGAALRTMREDAHVSQDQIAGALRLDQGGISRLESGTTRPYLDQVLAFDDACGKPAGWSLRKAGVIEDPVDVEGAIRHDVRLSDEAREIVLAAYRVAVARSSGS